jgi:hypothetical protein
MFDSRDPAAVSEAKNRNLYWFLLSGAILILLVVGAVLLFQKYKYDSSKTQLQASSTLKTVQKSVAFDALQHFKGLMKAPLPEVKATTSIAMDQVPELLLDFTAKYIRPTTVLGYQKLTFADGKTGYEEDVEKDIASAQGTLWDFKGGQSINTKNPVPLFKPVSATIDPLSGAGLSELEIAGNIMDIFYYRTGPNGTQTMGQIILYAK